MDNSELTFLLYVYFSWHVSICSTWIGILNQIFYFSSWQFILSLFKSNNFFFFGKLIDYLFGKLIDFLFWKLISFPFWKCWKYLYLIANVMFLTLLQVKSSNWSDCERRTHGHQVGGPVTEDIWSTSSRSCGTSWKPWSGRYFRIHSTSVSSCCTYREVSSRDNWRWKLLLLSSF